MLLLLLFCWLLRRSCRINIIVFIQSYLCIRCIASFIIIVIERSGSSSSISKSFVQLEKTQLDVAVDVLWAGY